MARWSNLSPQHRKLAVEVGVLVVMFVAFLGFSVYSSISSGESEELTPPPRLQTEFNTSIINDIRDTDTFQPNYGRDTGKPNPFTY